jgi:NADH dehydrogenase FAD-containing subunit
MAYIGGWKAVADVKFPSKGHSEQKVSGRLAWLVWRSAYFSMAVSVKNKILIPMYWFLTWIFGRDISKI